MNLVPFKKKSQGQNAANVGEAQSILSSPPPGCLAIGIDLGTTNSVVSIFHPGENHPVTLKYDDDFLVPSLIYFDKETDSIVVGKKVKTVSDSPAEIVRSTKRSMGNMQSVFQSNNKLFTPEYAAEEILKYLASHPLLQEEKEKWGALWAVITVPAHFDDAARLATIAAAQKAQINVIRIINEPTAAALAYSIMPTPNAEKRAKECVAVYDLGGGTFDVTLVEREELTFNVLSSEGDMHLGGDDIDSAFAAALKPLVATTAQLQPHEEHEVEQKLLLLAERAKKELQFSGEVLIKDDCLVADKAQIHTLFDRMEFEKFASEILKRTIFLTESAMHAAKRHPRQITRILLVGGSTRLALVYKMLSEYFPCSVDSRLEPDLAVSWGASLQAAIILGIKPDTLLVDVCSHTLGIGVAEDTRAVEANLKKMCKKYFLPYPISDTELLGRLGDRYEEFNRELQKLLHVAPILFRNSPLPAKRSEFFTTMYNNQHAVQVIVVQGEGETIGDNRLLGSFSFQLTPPAPKGTRCEIQLTYDVNGMVHVFAKQIGTDNEAVAKFDSRTGIVSGWTPPTEEDAPEEKKSESTPINNQLTIRARRYLMKLPPHSERYQNFHVLLQDYIMLLSEAQNGAENDAQLEDVEEKIMHTLEKDAP